MERLLGWGMQIFAVLGLWRGLIGALAIAVLGWPAGAAAQAFQTLYSFQGAPDGLLPFGVVVDPTTGNIYGTTRSEIAREKRAVILQASTSEIYGDPEIHPQPESYFGNVNTTGPRACYDEGKRCAETLYFDCRRSYRLPIKVARIFNTYGPRMLENDGRVISNFIVQALKDEPITLYGDGRQTRSFCYVDDLLDGLNLLMESPPTSLAHVILATLTRSQFAISPSSCFARSARNRASSTVRSRKMIRSGANR